MTKKQQGNKMKQEGRSGIAGSLDRAACKSMPEKPYWETEQGWDADGNCIHCGEVGCECPHPPASLSLNRAVCKSIVKMASAQEGRK